ncbi:MAG: hypothetical protein C0434_16465 [Xanthomonadaceae bacterium]|nr:hypothetical protein [Xanthomonadaceae bacterium]
MAKALRVASWNVEHFKDDPARAERVLAYLKAAKPDVFALYEVEGKGVFGPLVQAFPGYQFHITEGAQVQEILVGVKGGITGFFSQRLEFQIGQVSLRPGSLLTATVAGINYSLLFLHTKSSADPIGLGLRDAQFQKAFRLKEVLDAQAAGGAANFIVVGDLNTMGLDYASGIAIVADAEIARLAAEAGKAGMRLLGKAHPATWSNGSRSRYKPADLDHVLASKHLAFKRLHGAEVDVLGWPALTTAAERDAWIKAYSDHGLLVFELQKLPVPI